MTEGATPGSVQKSSGSSRPRPAPFVIYGQEMKAGATGHLEIPVARLPTGTDLSLPLTVMHGRRPGPVLWLSAAIHGDELNGIPIIRRVIDRVDPKALAGTIIAVPVVNVFGLLNASRYLPDRRDLNRSFPGSKRGSLAAQLASLFMTEVVHRSQYGLDFHTGSAGRDNLPQLRGYLDDPVTRELAEAFAPPVILHSGLRDGSLRGSAGELGIKALVYEAGEAGRFGSEAIWTGVEGTLRVMAHLGMIDHGPEAAPTPRVSRRSTWLRARRGGFCVLGTRLGSVLRPGDEVARLFDALGRDEVVLRSDREGIVIGLNRDALVNRGDAIAHVADLNAEPPPPLV